MRRGDLDDRLGELLPEPVKRLLVARLEELRRRGAREGADVPHALPVTLYLGRSGAVHDAELPVRASGE